MDGAHVIFGSATRVIWIHMLTHSHTQIYTTHTHIYTNTLTRILTLPVPPGNESDMGGLLLFLASKASAFVTGSVIWLDGGTSAIRSPLWGEEGWVVLMEGSVAVSMGWGGGVCVQWRCWRWKWFLCSLFTLALIFVDNDSYVVSSMYCIRINCKYSFPLIYVSDWRCKPNDSWNIRLMCKVGIYEQELGNPKKESWIQSEVQCHWSSDHIQMIFECSVRLSMLHVVRTAILTACSTYCLVWPWINKIPLQTLRFIQNIVCVHLGYLPGRYLSRMKDLTWFLTIRILVLFNIFECILALRSILKWAPNSLILF